MGPDNKYLPTTWTIKFHLDSIIKGTYNLRLAIASATRSDLEVNVTMIPSLRLSHILHSQISLNRHKHYTTDHLFPHFCPDFCQLYRPRSPGVPRNEPGDG